MIHIDLMSRTSPAAARSASTRRRISENASSEVAKKGEVVQAASLKHRPGRGRYCRRTAEELERMQDRGRADLEEDVPEALLRHVQRLPRVEHALVERHEAVDVVRQKGHVVYALDQRHPKLLYPKFSGPSPRGIAPSVTTTPRLPHGQA